MRKFLLLLAALLVLGGFWWFSGKDSVQTVKGFPQLGEEQAESGFQRAREWVEGIPARTSEEVGEWWTELKDGAKEKAAEMILSQATSTLERVISSIRAGEPEICLLQAVGREVGYNIGNPEGSEAEFDYSVDWGDGAKSSGRVPEGTKNAFVSHRYVQKGNYTVRFELKTKNGTTDSTGRVCVE